MNELRRTNRPIRLQNLSSLGGSIRAMPSMVELDNSEWARVEDLFDPPGRVGRPTTYSRRDVVHAILFIARTGCQ